MMVVYCHFRNDMGVFHGTVVEIETIGFQAPCDRCVWFVPGTFDADCEY